MKTLKNNFALKAAAYLVCVSLAFLSTSCGDDDNGGGGNNVNISMAVVSSNTGSAVLSLNTLDANNISSKTINVPYADADGITYDKNNDRLIQFDRSGNTLNAFNQFSTLADGATATPSFALATAITNGRELTQNGATVVVAEDVTDANKLHVFTVGSNSFNVDKVYDVNFNLWGIQLVNSTLYAVVDNSNQLAIFNNFGSSASGSLVPDKIISIEGIVRTHGLEYVASKDMMLMTDVGDGSVDTDGALRIITDFTSKLSNVSNNGTLAESMQVDISGIFTTLGNPVDVSYDANNDRIYVAERANQGGRVLGFDVPAANSGDLPDFAQSFGGASAIYLQN